MSGTVRRSGVVRNTVINIAANGAGIAITVLLTPLLIHRLGSSEYGVWILATTLTFSGGYLALAELGVHRSAVRLTAVADGRGDADGLVASVVATCLLSTVVGLAAGVGLVLLAGPFTSLFGISNSLRHTARVVFMLVGAQIACDLPCAAIWTFFEGTQRYFALRSLELFSRVIFATAAVVIVIYHPSLIGLGVASLATAGIVLSISLVIVLRSFPHQRSGLFTRVRMIMPDLLRGARPFLFLLVLSVVYNQMDVLIIGVALTTTAVARYSVVYKIHAATLLALSLAGSALLPRAAQIKDDKGALRRLYLEGTRLSVGLTLPLILAVALFARALLAAWVGTEFTSLSGPTRVFLIYPALAIFHVVAWNLMLGTGNGKIVVRVEVFLVLADLAGSILLVRPLGISGVIVGTVVGYAAVWVPYLAISLSQFGVTFAEWLTIVVRPSIPGLIVQTVVGLTSVAAVERWNNPIATLAAVGLSVAIGVGGFASQLGPAERGQIFGRLRRGTA